MMKNFTSSRMSKPLLILKSKFIVAVLFCLFVLKINGQVASYQFYQTAIPYTSLTETATSLSPVNWTDDVSRGIDIGFNFIFNGKTYTSTNVSSNGFITFGNTSTTPGSTNYAPISFSPSFFESNYEGAVSGLGVNLNNNGSAIKYQTSGMIGERVFTVQWENAIRRTGTTNRNGNFNFQIKLYEISNRIEVHYGASATTYNTPIPVQVGLRGLNNTDYNNRMGGTATWSNTIQGSADTSVLSTNGSPLSLPASGTLFVWAPQNFTTSGIFTVPCGVTSITVEAWGAGGGGGRVTTSGQTSGGGGGGAYAKKIFAVNAGDSFSYSIGSGGPGGASLNKNGGDTWFAGFGVIVFASGGKGVLDNSLQGGAGGLISGPAGYDAVYSGGKGGNGYGSGWTSGTGGGGGAARTNSNGGDGQTRIDAGRGAGGTSTSPGGNGGIGGGVLFGQNAESGYNYGGGGGGTVTNTSTDYDGGNGANGFIRISHATPSGVNKMYISSLTLWDSSNSWLPNGIPNSNTCVLIPSTRTVNVNVSNAVAKSVNVQNGGVLNINANQTLMVQDAFVNQGAAANVVVASDGNLLQVNPSKTINSGSITVQRQVTNMNNLTTLMDYVYWSSPVANQQTKGLGGFSPGTPVAFFSDYNEPNDMFYETLDPVFIAGKGYAVQAEGLPLANGYTKTYAFAGAPHNGDFSFNISRSPDQGGYQHGYNLVGNPYPSNIDFTKLYDANSALIHNNVYFWTNNIFTPTQQGSGYAGNNYAVFTGAGGIAPTGGSYTTAPNGIIKVGQGFIVQKRTVGGPSPLLFKNSYGVGQDLRVSTAGTFHQKNASEKDRFWLQLISPSNLTNNQLIGYIEGATDGFEQDYDAEIMGMSSDIFFSKLNDKQLLIQAKGIFVNTDKVGLGANFFSNGSYTIKLDHVEGIFANGQNIYLKDKQTGIITNLTQGSYTFTTNAGETNARFEIIYEPETVLATDATNKEKIVVYRENGDFVIKSPKEMERVEVYETSGKLIKILSPHSKSAILESATLVNGMYLLKIKTKDGAIVTKKIMR